jgi:hypothetical protein
MVADRAFGPSYKSRICYIAFFIYRDQQDFLQQIICLMVNARV